MWAKLGGKVENVLRRVVLARYTFHLVCWHSFNDPIIEWKVLIKHPILIRVLRTHSVLKKYLGLYFLQVGNSPLVFQSENLLGLHPMQIKSVVLHFFANARKILIRDDSKNFLESIVNHARGWGRQFSSQGSPYSIASELQSRLTLYRYLQSVLCIKYGIRHWSKTPQLRDSFNLI